MILAADSAQTNLASETSKMKNESMTQVTMCEITSLRNYHNVAKVGCDKTDTTFTHCELFEFKKMVTVGIFCLTELEFVFRMEDEIRQDFVQLSRKTITHMQITSVLKPGFETIYKASTTHSLLQNQHVTITCSWNTSTLPYAPGRAHPHGIRQCLCAYARNKHAADVRYHRVWVMHACPSLLDARY